MSSNSFIRSNFSVLLALLGLTTAVALIYYIQFYFHYQQLGVPFPWLLTFFGHFGTFYLFLLMSLAILKLSGRFKIQGLSMALLIHLLASVIFCLVYLYVSVAYNWLIGFSTPNQSVGQLFRYALTHNFHIPFIGYWTVVGLSHAQEFWNWYKVSEGERIALVQKADIDYIKTIQIKEKDSIINVQLSDILFLEAYDNYVKLHDKDKFYLMRSTLRSLESRLNPSKFCRIHRSFIVQVSAIDSVRKNRNGDATLLLASGAELSVSRNFRTNLESLL